MLAAAVDLILEHGTDKTTLAAIGEKAGYSRGLATYRFGSKAGLYDTLCKSIGRNTTSTRTSNGSTYRNVDIGES